MRAPEQEFVGYTDAQWTAVERIAARSGVELAGSARGELARLALMVLALDECDRPTAKQIARAERDALAKCKALQAALAKLAEVNFTSPLKTLRMALQNEMKFLEADIAVHEEACGGPAHNANSSKTVFLEQVFRYWVEAGGKPAGNDAVAFVFACVKPAFPDAVASAIERAIGRHRKSGQTRA